MSVLAREIAFKARLENLMQILMESTFFSFNPCHDIATLIRVIESDDLLYRANQDLNAALKEALGIVEAAVLDRTSLRRASSEARALIQSVLDDRLERRILPHPLM